MPVLGNDVQEIVFAKYKEVMKNATSYDALCYLKTRGEQHDHYYHYTKSDSAISICEGEEFWLQLLTASDDPDEAREDEFVAYSISFCYDTIENLSMWYLYGDLGQGVRLGYSGSDIARIFHDGEFYLFNKKSNEMSELFFGDDIPSDDRAEKCLSDVLYYKMARTGVITSYFGCDYLDCDTNVINELKKIHGGIFLKNLIWKYEFETRLVVFVPRKKVLDGAKSYMVKLRSPDIRKAQFLHGPEVRPIEVEHVISEYSGKVAVSERIKKNIK